MPAPKASDLRTLVEIVRQRSFARAAAALGVSPSAVSQFIGRLEARLGRKLLDRTTRTIRPTTLGERLTDAATLALEQLDAVYRLVDASAEEPGGTVRLTVPHVAMELVLLPNLAGFAERHPRVTLEISIEDRLIDPAGERFDAGIRRGCLVDDAMIARRIAPDDDLVLVASPGYILRQGMPDHPRELRDHRCIRVRRRHHGTTPPWRLACCGDRIDVSVSGSLVVDDPGVARSAAMNGMGIARLAHAFVAREIEGGSLDLVLNGWTASASGFHLYYPSQPPPSAALILVRDWLSARASVPKQSMSDIVQDTPPNV